MDKYKRYSGVIVLVVVVVALLFGAYTMLMPKVSELKSLQEQIIKKENEKSDLQRKINIVQGKIKKIKDSINMSQKKVYSPVESDLGNETLFFTLYNDVIEMLHANSVKIRAIDYVYNPDSDNFVKFGKDVYFVCDVNMELISNYVNLGKLIQDIYQYPYYIRINEMEVKPYPKDKRVLITNMSLRLYAHTAPEEVSTDSDAPILDGAETSLPQ